MPKKGPHLQIVPSSENQPKRVKFQAVPFEQTELKELQDMTRDKAEFILQFAAEHDPGKFILTAPQNLGFERSSLFHHPQNGDPYLRLTKNLSGLTEQQISEYLRRSLTKTIPENIVYLCGEDIASQINSQLPWSITITGVIEPVGTIYHFQAPSLNEVIQNTRKGLNIIL